MERNFELIRSKYLRSKAKKAQFRYFHKKMYSYAKSKKVEINNLPELEIGCGVTPMKDNFPNIISSDIENSPSADLIIDAVNLPYSNKSLKTIYAINCFHHISNKKKFIDESFRVLNDKGRLILLEPSFSLLSLIVYPFLFKDETYNIFSSLKQLKTFDCMKGANQAASYICFKKYPNTFLKNSGFKLNTIFHCTNSFGYIFSGGLNFPELLPFKFIKRMMNINFLSFVFSLHWIIVLEKN
tara:strand:- start:8352 stop:9074 length:723 start_codon:yes stop_codon:yes gene_type:complete